METIHGVKVKSWHDITIADFLLLNKIEKESKKLNLLQKRIKILSALSGRSESELVKIKEAEINRFFENELSFLNNEVTHVDLKDYYVINGKKYKLIKLIEELTAGQFIDLQSYSQDADNILDSIHLILTVFLIPIRELKPRQILTNKFHSLMTKVWIGKRFAKWINWKYNEGIPENYMETPCSISCEQIYEQMKITDAMAITLFFCVVGELFLLTTNLFLEMKAKEQLTSVSKILQTEKIPLNLQENTKHLISSMQDGTML